MPEYVSCNLCGADDARLLFRRGDYRYWIDDIEWSVVQCRPCGLAYVNPRPAREEIGRYYVGSYYNERGAFLQRYHRQARYVGDGPGRLLDVGTARGDFLVVMRDVGWQVEGIEPFADVGNPHRLEISHARFPEECGYAPESFDVVTAWAVFEHLHDPMAAFRACVDLLRPGGRLIVQVPSLRSVSVRIGHQEDVPRHLYVFSPRTLRRYAEVTGLDLVGISEVTDLFTAGSRGSLQQVAARALCRTERDLALLQRLPRAERFRRAPALAAVTMAAKALERLLLPDWLLRASGLSGQIVAEFAKPPAVAVPSFERAPAVGAASR